ncbi:InlB B-repeat-containing protein [bacterium]|nr:InlB B-repeat-containing protein [bacterium]
MKYEYTTTPPSENNKPTKTGYNFAYWYLDDENTEFGFNTPITGDITLTAKWTPKNLEYRIITHKEKIEEN